MDSPMGNVEQRVVRVVADWCGPQDTDVTAQSRLADLGLDSLTLLEVSLGLQKEFGVAVDDEQMAEAVTVAELVGLVKERLPADE
ncbi:MAG TPA: acyl carrier protein [Actinocrinis sp.]|uniref:acyl carrier protein n=1 Tax=Actinocrinis sp. TaxID=1920516 RepID=UPI002DDDA484|nr:acyl carrier protein [Actinocrinis sp.]HEV2344619.1 acyl carrier protein [Actinocrinis sp.]